LRADRAAAASSVFTRPSRSRCPAITTVAAGPKSSLRTFARDLRTFARDQSISDPASASTCTTDSPVPGTQADSRATRPPRPDL
jgi:hypothetical protein